MHVVFCEFHEKKIIFDQFQIYCFMVGRGEGGGAEAAISGLKQFIICMAVAQEIM